MKNLIRYSSFVITVGLWAMIMFADHPLATAQAVRGGANPESDAESAAQLEPGSSHLISPEDMAKLIQSAKGEKPLVLNIGPYLLYMQAHIPGAEYIGPSSDSQGMEALRKRIKSLSGDKFIVLYCGCCPWSHCPNVRAAYYELQKAGFSRAKVLYIANNLGVDWVYKGYPTIKGQ